jgi:hypothetical protein
MTSTLLRNQPKYRCSGWQRPLVAFHVITWLANWPEIAQHVRAAFGEWFNVIDCRCRVATYPAAVVPVGEASPQLLDGERNGLYVRHSNAPSHGVKLPLQSVVHVGRVLVSLLATQLFAVRAAVDALVVNIIFTLAVLAVVLAFCFWIRGTIRGGSGSELLSVGLVVVGHCPSVTLPVRAVPVRCAPTCACFTAPVGVELGSSASAAAFHAAEFTVAVRQGAS